MQSDKGSTDFGYGGSRWCALQRRDAEAACIIALVASRAGLSPHVLLLSSRCAAPIARSRQVAMYLVHTLCGRSQASVATTFGRDRTTVRHACRVIEDARDDPRFDEELTALEDGIEHGSDDADVAEAMRHAG